jgi:mRNA interferase MazF
VVLSVPPLEEERALVSYVPRTTAVRRTRFEVPHTARNFLPGVFDAQSLGTVPAVKLVRKLGILDSGTMNLVEAAVCRWLGLEKTEA